MEALAAGPAGTAGPAGAAIVAVRLQPGKRRRAALRVRAVEGLLACAVGAGLGMQEDCGAGMRDADPHACFMSGRSSCALRALMPPFTFRIA